MRLLLSTLLFIAITVTIAIVYWASTETENLFPHSEHEPSTGIGTFNDWVKFSPDDQSFVVRVPSLPQHARDEVNIPGYQETVGYDMYAVQAIDTSTFLISTITYPKTIEMADPHSVMQTLMQDFLNAPGAILEKAESSENLGDPRLDFVVRDTEHVIMARVISQGHTLFMLSYVASPLAVDRDAFQYFVDSFSY